LALSIEISHETIYKHIWGYKESGGDPYNLLRTNGEEQENPQIRDANRGIFWKIIRSGCCASRLNGTMKNITILTPCYNEIENVRRLCEEVMKVTSQISGIKFKHLFIDNYSTDGTQDELRKLAKEYHHIQVIINIRNFGHIRSPWHALMQSEGDAVIILPSDFQDPPSLIADFTEHWDNGKGYPVVIAVKKKSEEGRVIWFFRSLYYKLLDGISEIDLFKHYTGTGLYDRSVIENMRKLPDVYPYVRGIIPELGYSTKKITYTQQKRNKGRSKNNLYTLFDMGMLGITYHSKIPLRLSVIIGGLLTVTAMLYLLMSLLITVFAPDNFVIDIDLTIVVLFILSGVQMTFIGIVGEYVSSIHTQIFARPVIELERINFIDAKSSERDTRRRAGIA